MSGRHRGYNMKPDFMDRIEKIIADVRTRTCIDKIDVEVLETEVLEEILQDALNEYYDAGYDDGHSDGHSDGYENGYDDGYDDGKNANFNRSTS